MSAETGKLAAALASERDHPEVNVTHLLAAVALVRQPRT